MSKHLKEVLSELVYAKTMNFGEMPSMPEFEKAFENKLDGHFNWDLKGSDIDAVDGAGVDIDLDTTDAQELYNVIETLGGADDEEAWSLASGIMGMMGFEWV